MEAVLMMKSLQIVALALGVVGISACGGDLTADAPPVITDVHASTTAHPTPGQTIELFATVTASTDALDYLWTDDCGGTFADPGAKTTTWTAPSTAAVCHVRLEVWESGLRHDATHTDAWMAFQVNTTTVYESTPETLPPSLVSMAFEATATS